MNKVLYIAIMMMVLGACTSIDKELSGALGARDNRIKSFYATTEQSEPETKVYADENLKVLWNAGDLLSIFNQSTFNSKYQFVGEDGDNAGFFENVTQSGFHSGNPLDNIYAVYPYTSSNKIDNAGSTITMTLPAEQQYKEHSFGIGANTMVAVTDNDFLAFKNLGGYLQLRLYGNDVKVSSITIQGNNGEKISGKASVAVALGAMPTVTMDATATDAITIVCDPPVQLGTTAEQYTDFWFVIPPITFDGGFTVTVTDELGGVFQKTTTKTLTISRSTIEWMAALEVSPDYNSVNVVFDDANFKAYCVENFDTNDDGEISITEALLVTRIECNDRSIKSLSGVEHFVNLTWLNCNNNQLTSLDVSKIIALKYLFCYENQLTSLDVSKNTLLRELSCHSNQIKSLDVSHNTALTYLNCDKNQLTSLDVSNNTELTDLFCGLNQLTSLDVSKNTALTWLYCPDNQLTSLDVSKNTALTWLYCHSNQLTSLNVSNNTALTYFSCGNNQLTSLDVSKNTLLRELYCYSNQLTSLDVSNNTALRELYCYSNQLTILDVSKNVALKYFYCNDNLLASLDVSDNIALTQLYCYTNPNLVEIWMKAGQTINSLQYDTTVATIRYKDVIAFADANFKAYCVENFDKDNDGEISLQEALLVTSITVNPEVVASLKGIEYFTNLQSLDCHLQWDSVDSSDNGHHFYRNGEEVFCLLSSLDLSCNTALTSLNCYSNNLTSLDLSHNTAMTYLDCGFNQLTSLDVSHNTALTHMDCRSNQLTSLDVSHNTALASLSCRDNQLMNLDVSNNTALEYLSCSSNQLTNLDVSNNTLLEHFYCYENQLTSLDVSKNTEMKYLYCYENQLTSLDVSKNTLLRELFCFSNQLTSLDVSMNTALVDLRCGDSPNLTEIWLKTGQTIAYLLYDTSVATIKYK